VGSSTSPSSSPLLFTMLNEFDESVIMTSNPVAPDQEEIDLVKMKHDAESRGGEIEWTDRELWILYNFVPNY